MKALKGCVGKPFQYYRDTLVRRFRGPGAKWKRLGQFERIVQRPRDNVDQFYQYLKSQMNKAEHLMKDEDNSVYAILEQMKIHRFLEGLKSKDIKDKLYSESYDTLEEY